MRRVARQASSQVAAGPSTDSTNIDSTVTDNAALGTTDGAASGPSTVGTAGLADTSTAVATDAAAPTTSAQPASDGADQSVTGGGASGTSDTTRLATDPVGGVTSTSGAPAVQSALSSVTSLISSISTSLEQASSSTSSVTSDSLSSTDSLLSSTTDSTLSTQPSSTTEPTSSGSSIQSATDSSSITNSASSASNSNLANPSLTTSFTDIVTTLNGQVTTIVSPVATLNADTSSTLSTSHRNAIIAGGAVAGTVFILLCLAVVFVCRRRQKRAVALSHRYLPTPRSVMLAGEDDFDLAGPKQPQRAFGIFGSRRKKNTAHEYRDISSESGRDLNSSVMRELPSEPPPRLLRPVASKTGSYFQEGVWPPPDEGSQLSDPLMAASNVDLHSIVDEVMGPHSAPGQSSGAASSTSSLPRPSRLRGGAAESASLFSETSGDFMPPVPRHGESPTMSSVGSSFGDSPRHLRDWSTDSATGLLAGMDGGLRAARRSSSGSGPWLPPGAAHVRTASPTSPLRIVTEPQQSIHAAAVAASSSSPSTRAREKAKEAAQERRTSLIIANPAPETENDQASRQSTLQDDTASYSVSPSSTQQLRRFTSTMESGGMPYPDESPIDRRSVPASLAHGWLLDIDEDAPMPVPDPEVTVPGNVRNVREEIPPRYDMIRRDTSSSEVGEPSGSGLSRTRTS
ncbi:uncharacterized protein FOMMEDRAFT_143528 [Fomitiporia mediterranea MF3/22]|uniref:uncharacterized protein n=1 Tax=Fomitiporia mediterranea (strain MF3/22) TaxID=694068 RepID=UPI00044073F1|nr:uncharacterized protein FOMMEDRAFT_143528 [Fomitiporia mediterranea MF3/22]EJC98062.1 hypothetical protein FOMMEDRAFT_143528 [Fomitiporia mediterranea MF3/22]